MRIFLTGMPGSGKSYWMHQLATRLQYAAVDMDRAVQVQTGKTIPELFAISEPYFREAERAALHSIIDRYPGQVVVATGGGAPCYRDNQALMKAAGCVLYLDSSIDALLRNVRQPGETRPLLSGSTPAAQRHQLELLYASRKDLYAQAHIRIDTATATLESILAALEPYRNQLNSNIQ